MEQSGLLPLFCDEGWGGEASRPAGTEAQVSKQQPAAISKSYSLVDQLVKHTHAYTNRERHHILKICSSRFSVFAQSFTMRRSLSTARTRSTCHCAQEPAAAWTNLRSKIFLIIFDCRSARAEVYEGRTVIGGRKSQRYE